MRIIIRIFLSIILAVGPLMANMVVPLPQLNKPNFITAGEGWLCISEESSPIHLFRIERNSVKFIASFGRAGQGPGEFDWIHRLRILKDGLEIPTQGRYAHFDFTGNLLEERKLLLQVFKNQVYQIGPHFAARTFAWDQKHMVNTISLYDSDFKPLKEIGKIEVTDWMKQFNMAPDLLALLVDGESVIICSSTARESTVETFDSQGHSLRKISLPMKASPVTESLKESLIHSLRESYKSEAQWSEFSKKITFPVLTPGVKNVSLQEGQIICQSYQKRDNLAEYVIFDLSGKELKRTYLKYFDREPNGSQHCFYQGRLYYLIDNADKEVWELHIEDV